MCSHTSSSTNLEPNEEPHPEPTNSNSDENSSDSEPGGCGNDHVCSDDPVRALRKSVQLQAILAIIPLQSFNSSNANPFGTGAEHDDAMRTALECQQKKYEKYENMNQLIEQLKRLKIVEVYPNMVFFADRPKKKLFVAVYETNPRVENYLGKATSVQETYCKVRKNYQEYSAMGCGYSSGGGVLYELASLLRKDVENSFARVDIFNFSGLRRSYGGRNQTEFYVHDVHNLAPDPQGIIVPRRDVSIIEKAFSSMIGCCNSRMYPER